MGRDRALLGPGAELDEVNRLLKKGGYFFLSTINIGSAAARLTGPRWPWLMDMHIFYFDKRTITGILEDHGSPWFKSGTIPIT